MMIRIFRSPFPLSLSTRSSSSSLLSRPLPSTATMVIDLRSVSSSSSFVVRDTDDCFFIAAATAGRKWIHSNHATQHRHALLSHLHRQHSGKKRFLSFSKKRKEEIHIRNAIMHMKEHHHDLVVFVEHVSLTDCGFSLLPKQAQRTISNAHVVVRCLTHADTVSDEALRHQIRVAQDQHDQHNNPQKQKQKRQQLVAILALNMNDVETKDKQKTDKKQWKIIREVLGGGLVHNWTTQHQTQETAQPFRAMTKHRGYTPSKTYAVVGLPNAGKSTLVYALTRSRTLAARKKKDHHLPKIGANAGLTLGLKRHAFDMPGLFYGGNDHPHNTVSLMDSPGLRLQKQHLHWKDLVLLVASKSIEPFPGYKDTVLKGLINDSDDINNKNKTNPVIQAILDALNYHATISNNNTNHHNNSTTATNDNTKSANTPTTATTDDTDTTTAATTTTDDNRESDNNNEPQQRYPEYVSKLGGLINNRPTEDANVFRKAMKKHIKAYHSTNADQKTIKDEEIIRVVHQHEYGGFVFIRERPPYDNNNDDHSKNDEASTTTNNNKKEEEPCTINFDRTSPIVYMNDQAIHFLRLYKDR